MSISPEMAQIWSSFLTGGATVVLAVLTGTYVFLLRRQFTQQYCPRLVLLGMGGGSSGMVINAGNSPAVNVKFTRVGAGSSGQSGPRCIGLLNPGEYILLAVAGLDRHDSSRSGPDFSLVVEWQTLLGKTQRKTHSENQVRAGVTNGVHRTDLGQPAFKVTT
jgi:hypothetical protein